MAGNAVCHCYDVTGDISWSTKINSGYYLVMTSNSNFAIAGLFPHQWKTLFVRVFLRDQNELQNEFNQVIMHCNQMKKVLNVFNLAALLSS